MRQPDPICPVCTQKVAAGVLVLFENGDTVHLHCCKTPETTATLIWNFVASRPSENFCYTCLAVHLKRDRQEVEKTATALRAAQRIVVEPAVCATCKQARVTLQANF